MKKIVFAAFIAFSLFFKPTFSGEVPNWVVSYNNDTPVKDFEPYAVVVVDSSYSAENIKALREQGKQVFGFVSVGELNSSRKKTYAKFQNAVLGNNAQWSNDNEKVSYMDIRHADWQKYLLDEVLPALYNKGFDGVMLESVDTPLGLEAGQIEVSGKKTQDFQGMGKALAKFILDVRAKFSDKKIMLARGLPLFDRSDRARVFFKGETKGQFSQRAGALAKAIDFISLEGFLTGVCDGDCKGALAGKDNAFYLRSGKDFKNDLKITRAAKALNPELSFLSIDYWDLKDEKGVKHIYEKSRELGWVPYVGNLALSKVVSEPK